LLHIIKEQEYLLWADKRRVL